MIRSEMKFDFDDLLIVPTKSSSINSRKEVDVFDDNGMLPLFTAPMDTVIDITNIEIFKQNKIYPIIPRTVNFLDTKNWIAIGLREFKELFIDKKYDFDKKYILIDIANGHMLDMADTIKSAKNIYGDSLVLMVGNIANPETYEILSNAGADFIRCGVGNGGGCWIQGTKILTKSGYKNIENVNTDDIVLTHNGNWKSIILTHELDYNEDLVDINGEVSTKDHLYYAVYKRDSDKINSDNYKKYAMWIKAEDLTDEYLLLEMEKYD